MSLVRSVELIPGYIKITDDGGQAHLIGIADALRAADIPALTHEQVRMISTLADLIAVLIRTLIDRQVLDESFLEDGGYSLNDIVETLEAMGGDFGEPDLSTE